MGVGVDAGVDMGVDTTAIVEVEEEDTREVLDPTERLPGSSVKVVKTVCRVSTTVDELIVTVARVVLVSNTSSIQVTLPWTSGPRELSAVPPEISARLHVGCWPAHCLQACER
jgi:hypothetical protein